MDASRTTTPPTDHLGLEILGPDECWALVSRVPIGRVAFVEEGGPMVLPVMHSVVGHRIGFRSTSGGKLAAARRGEPVAFEVDGWDVATRTGWSVVARGSAESAPDSTAEHDAVAPDPWLAPIDDGTWVEIRVDEITGRRLGPTPS